MPGAGKSTVGVLLAKHLGLGFVDTDILIQERAGRRLQQILDEAGYRELRRLEEEALLELDAGGAVIATGGSAVYSARAVRRLRELGRIVYLKAGCAARARIDDYERRESPIPGGSLSRRSTGSERRCTSGGPTRSWRSTASRTRGWRGR
jgi:shikimate kinase